MTRLLSLVFSEQPALRSFHELSSFCREKTAQTQQCVMCVRVCVMCVSVCARVCVCHAQKSQHPPSPLFLRVQISSRAERYPRRDYLDRYCSILIFAGACSKQQCSLTSGEYECYHDIRDNPPCVIGCCLPSGGVAAPVIWISPFATYSFSIIFGLIAQPGLGGTWPFTHFRLTQSDRLKMMLTAVREECD